MIETIPLTAVGKVDRKALRGRVGELTGDASA